MKKSGGEKQNIILEECPHCGHPLSPWQQVLLSVDRALVCKNCWYRIILDPFEEEKKNNKESGDKNKGSGEDKE